MEHTLRKETLDKAAEERFLLDVQPIHQLPNLPTGCEATALTMLLHWVFQSTSAISLYDTNYLTLLFRPYEGDNCDRTHQGRKPFFADYTARRSENVWWKSK